jgi:hypothetical protein
LGVDFFLAALAVSVACEEPPGLVAANAPPVRAKTSAIVAATLL